MEGQGCCDLSPNGTGKLGQNPPYDERDEKDPFSVVS